MTWENILKAKKKPAKKDDKNYNWIIKPYRKWARECRAKGDTIGAASDVTLRNMLLNHVKKHRRGVSGARVNAYSVIEKIERIQAKGDITKEDYKIIISLIGYLEKLEGDKDSNPANIKFTTKSRMLRGNAVGKVVVRGHWRTARYRKIREALGKPVVDPVPDDWYVEGDRTNAPLNTAKPPLWQALFATPKDNSSTVIVKKGLLPILKEYKKVVEG
jgi:hypothetical protein